MPRRRRSKTEPILRALHPADARPRADAPGGPPERPRVAAITGHQIWQLRRGRTSVVGSGASADIAIADPYVSARHAALTPNHSGDVTICDLDSTNGLWVRGEAVGHAVLSCGDAALIGRRPLLIARPHSACADAVTWQGMTAASARMLRVFADIAAAAASDAPVWLHGESGSGKELAARAIHEASARRCGPWVALNCAALPESLAEAELFGVVRGAFTGADRTRAGAFERADGGTLLLDEIGELSPACQAKLLRVIESGELVPVGGARPIQVDVRIVAATWRDLEAAAAEGGFRLDLLHRLWVLRIDLPPLRARPEDVEPLLQVCLEQLGGHLAEVPQHLIEAACAARWPGNVRQLANHIRRAAILGDWRLLIPEGDQGVGRTRFPRRGLPGDEAARSMIRSTLVEFDNNRSASARALGISRSTLYRWLAEKR